MRAFLVNAVNSWVTSLAGTVIGLPELWEGMQPLMNSTGPADWGLAIRGAGILFVGLMARDWTKNVISK